MSINNLTKKQIIDELQLAEYFRDEMRQTLENIRELFHIDINMPDEWHYDNDEHFGDYIYDKLTEYKNNLPN